jgi:hypothetical protein
VVAVEVGRPGQREQVPVGPRVRDHVGEGRPVRQRPVVARQLRVRALAPRVNRQGVEQARRSGAVGDRERIAR